MSYEQLKDDVNDTSHRDDVDTRMDRFCLLAEALINKDLRVREMVRTQEFKLETDHKYLPDDYIAIRSLIEKTARDGEINADIDAGWTGEQDIDFTSEQVVTDIGCDRETLLNVTTEQLATWCSGRAYSIQDGYFRVSPAPTIITPLTGDLIYYAKVPTLTANTTNEVLDAYPLLYLSAMLIQVYLFVQDNDELQKWMGFYDNEISSANKTREEGNWHLPTIRVA